MFLKVVGTNTLAVNTGRKVRIVSQETIESNRMIKVVVLEDSPSPEEPFSFFLHDYVIRFLGEDARMQVEGYRMNHGGGKTSFEHVKLNLDVCATPA